MLDRIVAGARRADVGLVVVRAGSRHTVCRYAALRRTVPRRAELTGPTAPAIFGQLEPVAGRRWWA